FANPTTDSQEIVASAINTNTPTELMINGMLQDKDVNGGSITILNKTIFTNGQKVIKRASGNTIALQKLEVDKPQLIVAHLEGDRLVAGEIVQGAENKPIALFPFCQ